MFSAICEVSVAVSSSTKTKHCSTCLHRYALSTQHRPSCKPFFGEPQAQAQNYSFAAKQAQIPGMSGMPAAAGTTGMLNVFAFYLYQQRWVFLPSML